MSARPRWAVLGLSITSSWGNGHATTYRGLLRELARRGHAVTFFERDVPWYAARRDEDLPREVGVELYAGIDELFARHGAALRAADVVMLGSYVPEGAGIADRLFDSRAQGTAFYDIDTPVTLAALEEAQGCGYLRVDQVSGFDRYFSFAGGRALTRLRELGARHPYPLYCGVDPEAHAPVAVDPTWELGYLGTYAADRQPALDALMFDVARRQPAWRCIVGGPLYPPELEWPSNVAHREHVPPAEHGAFFGRQRYTLNLTRADMRALGHAPSVRLFEAAACGAAIISDEWDGLSAFLEPGREVLLAASADDVAGHIAGLSDADRRAIGARARARVLAAHTARHRAEELETAMLAPAGGAGRCA